MMEFHAAHQGVMDIRVIRHRHIPGMLLDDSQDSTAVVQSIAQWLTTAAARAKRDRFLCMDCDMTFHSRRLPEAFMIVTPFAARTHSMVTGICRRCADRDDAELLQAAISTMRKLYPNATEFEPGRSA